MNAEVNSYLTKLSKLRLQYNGVAIAECSVCSEDIVMTVWELAEMMQNEIVIRCGACSRFDGLTEVGNG